MEPTIALRAQGYGQILKGMVSLVKWHKYLILGILILWLFVSVVLLGCQGTRSKRPSLIFPGFKEQVNLNDLNLTIYFMSPFNATRVPFSIDTLIGFCIEHEGIYGDEDAVIVSVSNLEKHVDLLNQLINVDLIPAQRKTYLNARIYYVFETEKDGKIFDVAMWGWEIDNKTMFINELEVEADDIFYDVLRQFLPEDTVEQLENYLARLAERQTQID